MTFQSYDIDLQAFAHDTTGYDLNVQIYDVLSDFDSVIEYTGDGCIQESPDAPGGDIDGDGHSLPAAYPYGEGMNSFEGDGWSDSCVTCIDEQCSASICGTDLDDFIIWYVQQKL